MGLPLYWIPRGLQISKTSSRNVYVYFSFLVETYGRELNDSLKGRVTTNNQRMNSQIADVTEKGFAGGGTAQMVSVGETLQEGGEGVLPRGAGLLAPAGTNSLSQ